MSSFELMSRPTTFWSVIVLRICRFRSSRVRLEDLSAFSNSSSVARLYWRFTRSTATSTSSSVAATSSSFARSSRSFSSMISARSFRRASSGLLPACGEERKAANRFSKSVWVISRSLTRATIFSTSSPADAAAPRAAVRARAGTRRLIGEFITRPVRENSTGRGVRLSERRSVGDARHRSGRVEVDLLCSVGLIGDRDRVLDVREGAVEDPPVPVERAAVHDLDDHLDVARREEPEVHRVRRQDDALRPPRCPLRRDPPVDPDEEGRRARTERELAPRRLGVRAGGAHRPPGRPGRERGRIADACEPSLRVLVSPHAPGPDVPERDVVLDVRERAVEEPVRVVEPATVEDLVDDLDVVRREEPEVPRVPGDRTPEAEAREPLALHPVFGGDLEPVVVQTQLRRGGHADRVIVALVLEGPEPARLEAGDREGRPASEGGRDRDLFEARIPRDLVGHVEGELRAEPLVDADLVLRACTDGDREEAVVGHVKARQKVSRRCAAEEIEISRGLDAVSRDLVLFDSRLIRAQAHVEQL